METDDGMFTQTVFLRRHAGAKTTSWFGNLPMVPTKGRIVVFGYSGFPAEKEVLRGVFLAPLLNGEFVCGSTYEWQFADEGPDEASKAKLAGRSFPYVARSLRSEGAYGRHTARLARPTAFLGEHPTQKGLFVFNGLGTKGYLLAPYLSHCLAELLLNGVPLAKEMDVARLKNVF